MDISSLKLGNIENQSHSINDEGGFFIKDNQINYLDILNNISATYNLFDGDGEPTDTYIVKKVLVSKLENQLSFTLDKSGGSEIINNQQIYYDKDGVVSCKYNLYDINNKLTNSDIFQKILVQ